MKKQKTMKKQVSNAFGRAIILIGKHDGKKVWLEKGKWECGWYWSFGILCSYTNENPTKAKDLSGWTHWEGAILNEKNNAFDNFKSFFTESVLTDDELWILCDLMKSFYTAKAYAELLYHGNSHYTSEANTSEIVKNNVELKRINENLIPALIDKIYQILIP